MTDEERCVCTNEDGTVRCTNEAERADGYCKFCATARGLM